MCLHNFHDPSAQVYHRFQATCLLAIRMGHVFKGKYVVREGAPQCGSASLTFVQYDHTEYDYTSQKHFLGKYVVSGYQESPQ